MMNQEQIGGIVRAIVAAVAGYFVGQGLIDAETAATIGGAISVLAVAGWSIWLKRSVAAPAPEAK